LILCCGENLIDMVPETGTGAAYGTFRVAPGGCPYNSAIAAARLGADVRFVGAMASDFLGDRLFARLVQNGVGTDLVVRSPRPVTLAFVEKNEAGEARYAFYAEGAADRSLVATDLPQSFPDATTFLLLGSISFVLEPSATTIARLMQREKDRLLISFDPNIRPSLIPDRKAYLERFEAACGACAIVKASDTDLEWLYGPTPLEMLIPRILALGPEAVFVTQGAKGSMAATGKARASVEAFKIPVVDTIGAGDTFHAALLTGMERMGVARRSDIAALDEEELRNLLGFASAAAAINCTREGADPPWAEELVRAYPDCGCFHKTL